MQDFELSFNASLSDVVRAAIERASNLEAYQVKDLTAETNWVVGIPEGQSADALAVELGAKNLGATGYIPNTFFWEFPVQSDKIAGIEGPGPLTLAALEDGVTNGRGGLGNIYTWAAGNGLGSNDNVNYDGYANSRYTIAVSAIDHHGEQSSYSEPGAPIMVAAYSSGDGVGITTTDRTGSAGYSSGDYTNSFGGTSSATPLVSGVIALMLEANPTLTWRDVQHILVETAEHNDPTDSDWQANGAGHLVNHKYGFGAIDATAAVTAADSWTTVAPEVFTTSGIINVNKAIPDNNLTGITSSFTIAEDIKIESLEVIFDATHTYRGNLEIALTSPAGTQSILAEKHSDSGDDYDNWVFTSARHWDESSTGNWTLQVSDLTAGDLGTWNSWKLNLYGTVEQPSISISNGKPNPAVEGTNPTQKFTVKLSAASTSPITVKYATKNGSAIAPDDYKSKSGTLTFAPGETSKTVKITIINDGKKDSKAVESYSVNLSNPTNATIDDGKGVGKIQDAQSALVAEVGFKEFDPVTNFAAAGVSDGSLGAKASFPERGELLASVMGASRFDEFTLKEDMPFAAHTGVIPETTPVFG